MTKIITLIIIVFPIVLHAAFEKLEIGAGPLALGNACVALKNNPYAIYFNPANIQCSENSYLGLSYRSFYGLSDIKELNIISCFNFWGSPFALGINRFGNGIYQEYQFHMGSKFILSDDATMGISLQYYFLKIDRYGSHSSCGMNLGFQYRIIKELYVGALIMNLNQPIIGKYKEKLPQSVALGFYYIPLAAIEINFELFRDMHFSQDYRAGFAINLTPALILRAGISDKTNSYSLGFGTCLESVKFDYAIVVHQILGASHILTLVIDI